MALAPKRVILPPTQLQLLADSGAGEGGGIFFPKGVNGRTWDAVSQQLSSLTDLQHRLKEERLAVGGADLRGSAVVIVFACGSSDRPGDEIAGCGGPR